jgi:4-cresol dehydrogenase (hydroxylating)
VISRALEAWRLIVGAQHVHTTDDALRRAQTATFATSSRVVAVVRPRDSAQVGACLEIGCSLGVPLHPISRGRNWGLGSAVPPDPIAAVLDLGRLDAILSFDETQALVTVEPGVTFAQLHAFLRERESQCFMPAIGGPADASVVGNALQRGHGIGPASRRSDAIGSIRGFRHDGTPVASGFPRGYAFAGAESHRHGLGPSLSGLFLQGSGYVVTEMALALERKPRELRLFAGRIGDHEALAELLHRVRSLVLEGALGRHVLTVWNTYKDLACQGGYPWSAMANHTPLDLSAVGREPSWILAGALYAPSRLHAAAAQEALLSLRTTVQDLRLLDPDSGVAVEAAPAFLGTPTARNTRSVYWRKRSSPQGPARPEHDHCGVFQLCPLLPAGRDAVPALKTIEELVLGHGYEPQIGFDLSDPRTIEAFVTIAYDRDKPGEDERASDCHDGVLIALTEAGFPPYRIGIQSSGLPHPVGKLRDALLDTTGDGGGSVKFSV